MEKSSCEEIAVSGLVSLIRGPDHLHGVGLHPLLLVSVVQPAEEETIEAHVSKYVGLFSAVAERINLPGHPRSSGLSEIVRQKSEQFIGLSLHYLRRPKVSSNKYKGRL